MQGLWCQKRRTTSPCETLRCFVLFRDSTVQIAYNQNKSIKGQQEGFAKWLITQQTRCDVEAPCRIIMQGILRIQMKWRLWYKFNRNVTTPHICPYWYTTSVIRPVKVNRKVTQMHDKIAQNRPKSCVRYAKNGHWLENTLPLVVAVVITMNVTRYFWRK